MRLQIVHHLEFVLHVSEKPIGAGQIGLLFFRKNTGLLESHQRIERATTKNSRQPTASQHLDCLNEKFDFSDPSDAELDVALFMPALRDLCINPFLDRSNLLDNSESHFDIRVFG